MSSDADLLLAWQGGDRQAGGELFDRYFASVRRFFHNKVKDGMEDLIQQSFLAVVQHRDRIQDPAAFRGYLFAAARSKLYDHIRRHTRPEAELDFEVSSIVDVGLSPSGVLAAKQDERLLLLALRHLPLDLQVALELYYFERVRGEELVLALGVPGGTVRSRLRRGLEILRRKLDELADSPELLAQTTSNLEDWARRLADDHGGVD